MSLSPPPPSPSSTMATSSSTSKKSTRGRLFYPIDPSSPVLVLNGTLASSALGAAMGASIGMYRTQNPLTLGFNMGGNFLIASLSFFASREYLITPLLTLLHATPAHSQRYAALSAKQQGKLPEGAAAAYSPSMGELRRDKLLDSALAGGVTGAGLMALFRGTRHLPRAALTSSLLATTLQLGANSLRILRLELLASRQAPPPDADTDGVYIPPPQSDPAPPEMLTRSSVLRSLDDPSPSPSSSPPTPNPRGQRMGLDDIPDPTQTFPARLIETLSKVLPIRKVDDDEYLQMLEKKRATVEKRLNEIEAEELRLFEDDDGK